MEEKTMYRCDPTRTHGVLARWFPVPNVLLPRAAGIDISDSSIKWLELEPASKGFEVKTFTFTPLEPGVVVEGVVQDEERLGTAIKELRKNAKGSVHVHVALPEEAAFIFTMHVVSAHDREQVLSMIEFELENRVPLDPDAVVYDYNIINWHTHDDGAEISVSVFPKKIINGYMNACTHAGVVLLSLEIEASSIARSVLPIHARGVALIVDFGRARTGIIITNCGVPIFTSTVMVGGDAMTKIIMDILSVDEVKAEEFKNEQGIARGADKKVMEAVSGTAQALADEIAKHFEYWDTRRDAHGNRVTPVTQVILTGGSSNLKGLDEYIAGKVRAPTVHAHVWQNVCSFNECIPPVDAHHSLGLSTVIGLALRGM